MKNELIKEWLKIGKKNYWIREARDPEFNENSFSECGNIAEFLKELEQGNWCLGQAFYWNDICLINQVNGGDEWLVIKGKTTIDSFTTQSFKPGELFATINAIDTLPEEKVKSEWFRLSKI